MFRQLIILLLLLFANQIFATQNYDSVPSSILEIKEKDKVLGNRDSKVVIIEYSSPTCPHCSTFHQKILPKLKSKYIDTNKIAFVFREFITNKQDFEASILCRCGDDFFKMLDILYDKQFSWAFNRNYKSILSEIGVISGIPINKQKECSENKDLIAFPISNTKELALNFKGVGTPFIIVGGKVFKGFRTMENLSQEIDKLLE